jgi:hypothetical protein
MTVLICTVVGVAPVTAATVSIDPPALATAPGETVNLSVRVAGDDSVSCFLVELSFDAGMLQLVSADEGTLFASSGHPSMFDWDEVADGLHVVNDVLLGPGTYVVAPGELASLTFEVCGVGATSIEISTVDLRDAVRDPIVPVDVEGCMVEVSDWSSTPEGGPWASGGNRVEPNPATRRAVLAFAERGAGPVTVTVFDVRGREVRRLDAPGRAGEATWDLRDAEGHLVPSGVYFARTNDHGSRFRITVVR